MPDREAADLTWRKSSYSNGANGDCVEVAVTRSDVHVRDSKIPAGGTLTLPRAGWQAFLTTVTER